VLALAHNSFYGTIPTELALLKELRTLELSNNQLTGTIPSELGYLENLESFSMLSNSITGSIPTTFVNLHSLRSINLKENLLSGSLQSELCSLNSASINLNSNPELHCYELCWQSAVLNGSLTVPFETTLCSPSSVPTSAPSFEIRHHKETNNGFNLLYTIALVVGFILLIICCYYTYVHAYGYWRQCIRIRKLPIHSAIFWHKSLDETLATIRDYPETSHEVDYYDRTALELAIHYRSDHFIIADLLKLCLPFDVSTKSPVDPSKHRYVWSDIVEDDDYVDVVVSAIMMSNLEIASHLALAIDDNGRTVMDIASPKNRSVIREATYFMRRYNFFDATTPQHKSSTCLIHLA
jgi:hypothetical protein